jgi:hypothetical protein
MSPSRSHAAVLGATRLWLKHSVRKFLREIVGFNRFFFNWDFHRAAIMARGHERSRPALLS